MYYICTVHRGQLLCIVARRGSFLCHVHLRWPLANETACKTGQMHPASWERQAGDSLLPTKQVCLHHKPYFSEQMARPSNCPICNYGQMLCMPLFLTIYLCIHAWSFRCLGVAFVAWFTTVLCVLAHACVSVHTYLWRRHVSTQCRCM